MAGLTEPVAAKPGFSYDYSFPCFCRQRPKLNFVRGELFLVHPSCIKIPDETVTLQNSLKMHFLICYNFGMGKNNSLQSKLVNKQENCNLGKMAVSNKTRQVYNLFQDLT